MDLSNRYPSLKDKLILITGGANGIGAAMVKAFCEQGAKVCFCDKDSNSAQVLRQELSEYSVSFYFCDLANIQMLQAEIANIQKLHGSVDVLVNNAANDRRHTVEDVSESFWDEGIASNLKHYFFCIQAVAEGMKSKGGGSIINLGSGSWHAKQANIPVYTTSKAGIEGLTRGLARDLGACNIRINTLVPGWVMTPRQRLEIVNKQSKEYIEQNQCINQDLLEEDICAMALFLASDDSKMCTAQNFIVDGGWI